MKLNKTLMLNSEDPEKPFTKTDALAINRDLDNIFTGIQEIEKRPRTVTTDPQDADAGDRPKANYVGEIVYYSADLYFCTNISTPTFKKITAI
jgi:hypothetical protein